MAGMVSGRADRLYKIDFANSAQLSLTNSCASKTRLDESKQGKKYGQYRWQWQFRRRGNEFREAIRVQVRVDRWMQGGGDANFQIRFANKFCCNDVTTHWSRVSGLNVDSGVGAASGFIPLCRVYWQLQQTYVSPSWLIIGERQRGIVIPGSTQADTCVCLLQWHKSRWSRIVFSFAIIFAFNLKLLAFELLTTSH